MTAVCSKMRTIVVATKWQPSPRVFTTGNRRPTGDQLAIGYRRLDCSGALKMQDWKMQDWKITDLNLPNLKFDGLAMRVSIARFC